MSGYHSTEPRILRTVAVLIGAVKASESAQPGIVIRRGAILNGAALKFDASVTTLQAEAKLALSDLGIVIKE